MVSQLIWFDSGFTVIESLLGYVQAMYYVHICVFNVSIMSILNVLGVFLNVVI